MARAAIKPPAPVPVIYRVISPLKHDGVQYWPGDCVHDLTAGQAATLLEAGVIEVSA